MRRWNLLLATILILSTCASIAAQQGRRAIRPEDVYLLTTVSDPQISVDGKSVVYVLTSVDREKNKRVSTIWTVPVDGSTKPEKFIDKTSARFPRWSPDGKWLAFISAGEIKSAVAPMTGEPPVSKTPAPAKRAQPGAQIWVVSRDGASPRQITTFQNGVSAFDWSPDSSRLVVVTRTAVGDRNVPSSDVRHYTSIVYKNNGSGWYGHNHNHLWVVPLAAGKPEQITFGDASDDGGPRWSPDGKWIAYVRKESNDTLRQTLNASELLVVPAAGGPPHRIGSSQTSSKDPAWSPDSRSIAYIAEHTASDQPLLWIEDASGNHQPALADGADLFPTEIHWNSDGVLWFGATDRGTAHFFKITPGSHHATLVVGGERGVHEASFSVEAGKIAFVSNDPLHPLALFAADLQDRNEQQLTFHNKSLLAQLDLQGVERLHFKGADGWPIEGFFMKPRGWQSMGHYPMILAIHGGPAGMFGEFWEMDLQLYAAQGWAVLFCNPRGSTGYGMRFQRGVAEQWGGNPYKDLMDGVDFTLEKYPWIDRNRLGVVGWSYGGFMTDWTITQTHRFKAAISIAGISDLISVEGTRDFAYGHSRDFGGDMFQSPGLYRKYSAVLYAGNVTTPTLFLQGEADQRVPESQSEEYFRALKHFGIPTELVLFPRENHMLPVAAEPKHLVESYEWRLYWFQRYLTGSSSVQAPD